MVPAASQIEALHLDTARSALRTAELPDVHYGRALGRMLELTRPHRRLMRRSLLLTAGVVAAELAIPFLFGREIGDIEAKDESRIVLFGLLIVAAGAARSVFSALREITIGAMGIQVEVDVRNRLYVHMLHLDRSFHARQRAGELVSRIMVTSGPIRDFLAESLPYLVQDVLALILTFAVLLALDPQLALVVLSPTPLVAWLAIRFNRRVAPALERSQECIATMTGDADETIQGSVAVKLLRAEGVRLERFSRRIADWYAAAHSVNKATAFYDPAVTSLPDLGRAALLAWGAISVLEARLDLATLAIFVAYLGMLLTPLQNLCDTFSYLQDAIAATNRLFAVLDQTATVTSRDDAVAIAPTPTDVVLRGVSKRWHPERDAVSELQLAIAARRNVAIIGRPGSGKSALLQLLNRVYDPDAGELQAGGVRFTEVELRSLRRLIVTVGSVPHLFPMSLRDNLLYGASRVDEAQMRRVAAAIGLAPVVGRLPAGYDTVLGERGEPLSVAEAQLVNIAQAVLAAPGILLLDDATAPLPAEVERTVIDGLKKLCHHITVIAAANRPALLSLADEAIVLDRGKLVAHATVAHLLNDCTAFHELLHRWGLVMEPAAPPGATPDADSEAKAPTTIAETA